MSRMTLAAVLIFLSGCAMSPNALFGDGESFYLGHRIDGAILLRRA